MKVLITTSFSVLTLDINKEKISTIHRGDGLYYGITQNKQNIYIAARKRMVSSNIAQEEERGEILVFSKTLQLKNRIQAPFHLRDLHQIEWHDGKLWLTCSYDNMIAVWDGHFWDKWFPQSELHDGPRDIHHYNSLLFEDHKIWVLAHKRGPSELLAYSLKDRKILERISLGNCAHNIWRENDELYVCSSTDGIIMGSLGFRKTVGGFIRGYCSDGNIRCVGVSELAERKCRDMTMGKILVFDMQWNLLKTISLPKEGLILDIMSVLNKLNLKDILPEILKKTSLFKK